MDLQTRMVERAGIVAEPHEDWVQNVVRSLTDAFDSVLLGAHYLILDRDPVFTKGVHQMLRQAGGMVRVEGRI